MQAARILALVSSLALAAAVLAPLADADDHDCACAPRGYRTARGTARVTRNTSGTCHVRDPHHPSTRYVIPRHNRGARAYGGCGTRSGYGPWSEMRPYLPNGRAEIRRMHVRNYFLRRYPFAQAAAEATEPPGAIDTLLAIGDAELGSERPLDTAGHLDRGMARFFTADYEGARVDFEAVLAAKAGEPRARWGLLMVSVCKNQWGEAARRLDTLAQAGEIRRGDRLVAAGVFAEPAKFDALVTGLRSYAGYRVSDGDAHLVTAWALAVQGKEALAKRYVRLAKRWKPSHAAIGALEQTLSPPPPAPESKTESEATPADTPETTKAPKADLHRQIAKLGR